MESNTQLLLIYFKEVQGSVDFSADFSNKTNYFGGDFSSECFFVNDQVDQITNGVATKKTSKALSIKGLKKVCEPVEKTIFYRELPGVALVKCAISLIF